MADNSTRSNRRGFQKRQGCRRSAIARAVSDATAEMLGAPANDERGYPHGQVTAVESSVCQAGS